MKHMFNVEYSKNHIITGKSICSHCAVQDYEAAWKIIGYNVNMAYLTQVSAYSLNVTLKTNFIR